MRIIEQTPERLVLELRPVGLMVLCLGLFLLFFVLGFGMRFFLPFLAGMGGFSRMPGLSSFAPGTGLLGYASIIPLLVAIFVLKTRRLIFDRATGKITVATRGFLGRNEVSYPMADFRGASVSSSRSGTNGTSYRAMLHFNDKTVPVTPYGTGGNGPSRTVEAINSWLGPGVSGPSQLSGAQAVAVAAALDRLGIKPPR
jgi:hypothetical protein